MCLADSLLKFLSLKSLNSLCDRSFQFLIIVHNKCSVKIDQCTTPFLKRENGTYVQSSLYCAIKSVIQRLVCGWLSIHLSAK